MTDARLTRSQVDDDEPQQIGGATGLHDDKITTAATIDDHANDPDDDGDDGDDDGGNASIYIGSRADSGDDVEMENESRDEEEKEEEIIARDISSRAVTDGDVDMEREIEGEKKDRDEEEQGLDTWCRWWEEPVPEWFQWKDRTLGRVAISAPLLQGYTSTSALSWIQYWTDGSVRPQRSGGSVFVYADTNGIWHSRITALGELYVGSHNDNVDFTEMWAIWGAIEHAKEVRSRTFPTRSELPLRAFTDFRLERGDQLRHVEIITDSLNSRNLIANTRAGRTTPTLLGFLASSVVWRIKDLESSGGPVVLVEWVKAHAGTKGNEIADREAKDASLWSWDVAAMYGSSAPPPPPPRTPNYRQLPP